MLGGSGGSANREFDASFARLAVNVNFVLGRQVKSSAG